MNIAIVGATSAIAIAFARIRALRGDSFRLIARNGDRVDAVAKDLVARGAGSVRTVLQDMAIPLSAKALLAEIESDSWCTDIVLLAHGVLPDQTACERDPDLIASIVATNLTSTIELSLAMAQAMALRGNGVVVVIGSVAGDRARPSNYIYGSTKAALAAFCDGLRARVAPRNVQVTLVKPGMVRSPMTEHLPTNPLFADPAVVAADIDKAIRLNRSEIYTPSYWRLIMLLVRWLPSRVIRRM